MGNSQILWCYIVHLSYNYLNSVYFKYKHIAKNLVKNIILIFFITNCKYTPLRTLYNQDIVVAQQYATFVFFNAMLWYWICWGSTNLSLVKPYLFVTICGCLADHITVLLMMYLTFQSGLIYFPVSVILHAWKPLILVLTFAAT